MSRDERIVHLDEAESFDSSRSRHYAMSCKPLARAVGGKRIGCTFYEVPPGKRPCPYHWHAANEEAIYVLGGKGTLRLAGVEHALEPGTYVACTAGEEGAHQVVNTSDAPIRYLVFSTMIQPEVAFYPDSETVGALGGPTLTSFHRMDQAVGYYDGEEAGD